MDVSEWFDRMESEWRSATPWPWPRTMTDDEVETMQHVTGAKFIDGVFVYGEPRMRYDGTIRCFSITTKIAA